jgi:L-asparaginase
MRKDFDTGALKAFTLVLLEAIPVGTIDLWDWDYFIWGFHWFSLTWNCKNGLKKSVIEENYLRPWWFCSSFMDQIQCLIQYWVYAENLAKPVVSTGSNTNWDLYWCQRKLDYTFKLVSLQENGQAVISEVCLYFFEYKLYRGNRTTKINAEHFLYVHLLPTSILSYESLR